MTVGKHVDWPQDGDVWDKSGAVKWGGGSGKQGNEEQERLAGVWFWRVSDIFESLFCCQWEVIKSWSVEKDRCDLQFQEMTPVYLMHKRYMGESRQPRNKTSKEIFSATGMWHHAPQMKNRENVEHRTNSEDIYITFFFHCTIQIRLYSLKHFPIYLWQHTLGLQ